MRLLREGDVVITEKAGLVGRAITADRNGGFRSKLIAAGGWPHWSANGAPMNDHTEYNYGAVIGIDGEDTP